jgi:hypothetical protein
MYDSQLKRRFMNMKPWPAKTECPYDGFQEFKKFLNKASYHNAAEGAGEMGDAATAIYNAVDVAIAHNWPYWVMNRMFSEIQPLVTWDSFMHKYITALKGRIKNYEA